MTLRLHFDSTVNSISAPVIDPNHELPDLVVISGRNGAGKTHLLEALRDSGSHATAMDLETRLDTLLQVAEFAASPPDVQIVPPVLPSMDREALVSQFRATVNAVSYQVRERPMIPPGGRQDFRAALVETLDATGTLTKAALAKAELRAGKEIQHWNETDFLLCTPLEIGVAPPFTLSLTRLFRTYSDLLVRNRFKHWQNSEGHEFDATALSEIEFTAQYGPKPWELLTDTFVLLGLPYTFDAPRFLPGDLGSPPTLRTIDTGATLPLEALSSGEIALLDIAKSVYSFSQRSDVIRMPGLLVMDEPDATLHPSMIRSMLRLVGELFVKQHGIRVIMTTHSPTTVALAPVSSLYVMERNQSLPRLRQANSKDEALSHLLVGVPTISVNYDNRRVVLVESKIDALRYQKISAVLEQHLKSERSLIFMPAGGDKSTNSCDVVIDMVGKLRENGNLAVWGLIDRDMRSSSHPGIHMNIERYTIENFLLDPLSLALLLLREGIGDLRASRSGYFDFDAALQGQAVVDAVTEAVRDPSDDTTKVQIDYLGGFTLTLERFWLEKKGHDLHDRVLSTFPPLNRFKSHLEETIVERVWGDRESVVPLSMVKTLRDLLA